MNAQKTVAPKGKKPEVADPEVQSERRARILKARCLFDLPTSNRRDPNWRNPILVFAEQALASVSPDRRDDEAILIRGLASALAHEVEVQSVLEYRLSGVKERYAVLKKKRNHERLVARKTIQGQTRRINRLRERIAPWDT